MSKILWTTATFLFALVIGIPAWGQARPPGKVSWRRHSTPTQSEYLTREEVADREFESSLTNEAFDGGMSQQSSVSFGGEPGVNSPYRRVVAYVRADALFLDRNNETKRVVVQDNVSLKALATSRQLDFGTEVGPRIAVGIYDGPENVWEASYFGIGQWQSTTEVRGNDNLRIPGAIALATEDFLDADVVLLSYSSEFHNAELNFIASNLLDDMPVSAILGFRYVSLSERFTINSTDQDTGSSDYDVRTSNDLFGGQLGVATLRHDGCARYGITAKVGVYGNAAKQSTFLGDFDNTFVFRNLSVSGDTAAFVGEMAFNSEHQLSRSWSIRLGYNLLWVEGVALAPNQLDFSDSPTSSQSIDTSGGVFMHGANVGIAAIW